MLNVLVWVFALAAMMQQEMPPGTLITAEDHGATLKESVAKGTVVVSGNRIAVEVKELTPRLADMR